MAVLSERVMSSSRRSVGALSELPVALNARAFMLFLPVSSPPQPR